MLNNMGIYQKLICISTDFDQLKLGLKIPCSYRCFTISSKSFDSSKSTRKFDQPNVCTYRLLNNVERNCTSTKREVLIMVFALHKFQNYILGKKFIFFIYHMALVYLVNKPQVLSIIAQWLLLSLKYNFKIIYKPSRSHQVI